MAGCKSRREAELRSPSPPQIVEMMYTIHDLLAHAMSQRNDRWQGVAGLVEPNWHCLQTGRKQHLPLPSLLYFTISALSGLTPSPYIT